MKQDIAIYGGAFDPIHLGHVRVAQSVSERLNIPVWITPAAFHPFGKKMTPYHQRVEMIQLAIRGIPGVEIAQHELRNYSGLTADLSALLRAEHPDKNFRIIMGEDNAQIIKAKWKGYERIIEHHALIIMSRPGYPRTPDWYHEAPHVSVPWDEIQVSSSEIRQLLHDDQMSKVMKLLHPDVLTYIIDNNLYLKDEQNPHS